MRRPITTLEEEQARWVAVQRQVAQMEDLTICEQTLGDLKDLLSYWRRYQSYVETHRQTWPLERYRALRKHLKRVIRTLKQLYHEHLTMQALTLQRASLERTAEAPDDARPEHREPDRHADEAARFRQPVDLCRAPGRPA